MTWLHPTLLLATPIAALPLIVHWLMRPRRRVVRFPALTLLCGMLETGQRARRLRNLLLLAARTLLLALAVVLLAGPRWSRAAAASGLPTLVVLVVDDSWSARYAAAADETTLDPLLARARTMIAGWPSDGGPTRVALLWAAPDSERAGPSEAPAVVVDALRLNAAPAAHAAPLGNALERAAALFRAAPETNRWLVVATDLAAHAWRDVDAELLAGLEPLRVRILAPRNLSRTNLALTHVQARAPQPETLAVPLTVQVAAQGVDASCRLVVREGPRVLARAGPVHVRDGRPQPVRVQLPPLPKGLHGLHIALEPEDRLGLDQERYLCIETAEQPRAWLVTPPGGGPDQDLAARVFANLLAPQALAAEQRPVRLEWRVGPELARADAPGDGRSDADPPDLIVLLPGVRFAPSAAQRLGSYVDRGATLLLAPGSAAQDVDWPGLRMRLAVDAPRIELLPMPLRLTRTAAAGRAAIDEAVLDEFADATVRRRLRFDRLADDVQVLVRASDDVPAILMQRRGGVVYVLMVSPDPAWSELGVRAAGLLTWLQGLSRAGPSAGRVAAFDAGAQPSQPIGPTLTIDRVHVRREPSPGENGARGRDESAGVDVSLEAGSPRPSWPAKRPGNYTVSQVDGAPVAMYAVNWPAEESDLRPADASEVQRRLGGVDVSIDAGDGADGAVGGRADRGEMPSAAQMASGALLLLLLAETFLSRRPRP